jgi:D-alanyl-D-alanine carboxypeptidase (penicillin-binding protein 5/6)
MLGGAAIGLAMGCALIAAAAVPLPSGAPSLHLRLELSSAAGPSPDVPFPSEGESAVAIPTLGFETATPNQHAQPIASLTKLMTAYVTLHQLPLDTSSSGPSIQVSSSDVTVYREEVHTNQSSVKVVYGEVLTERQLLDGLLVHSASNYAVLLAELVSGSESAMVSDMNATAATLGLHSTTYADVSGFDPASQSSAVDQLHLAELLMRDATFARIVRLPEVWLPVAGIVTTYTPGLGSMPGLPATPGVVGTKSGTTHEAGGCDVMAYDASVGRHDVQVLSVVLGQFPKVLGRSNVVAAGLAALVLAKGAIEHAHAWRVTTGRHDVGTLGWGSQRVPVLAVSTIIVPVFSSIGATTKILYEPWPASRVRAGRTLATVFVTSGAYREVTTLVAGATLARASLWQRLR